MKKLLFGVLLIAMVASMIGAGTWAYFTDIEMSYGNLFTAGSLDLKIDGNDDPITIPWDPSDLDCLAPCDEGFAEVTYSNEGCVPGYPDIRFFITNCAENGMPEPEIDAGDTTWGPDGGELCEHLDITVKVTYGGSEETIIQGKSLDFLDGLPHSTYLTDPGETIGEGESMLCRIEWRIDCDFDNEWSNLIMTDICEFDVEFSLHQAQESFVKYGLTIDQTASCCDVFPTGYPTAPAGMVTVIPDIPEGFTVQLDASDIGECCDFVDWTGVDSSTLKEASIEMTGNKTISANCGAGSFDLTVDQTMSCCSVDVGAPVSATVAAYTTNTFNVPCVDASTPAVVSLTASGPGGCTFDDPLWDGDVDDDANTNPNSVTMDKDQTVTADCTSLTYALTVVSDGCCPIEVTGDATGSIPAGESDTFSGLEYDDVVNVSADDSDPCCDFVEWSDTGAKQHDITITGTSTVTATCVEDTSSLTVDQTLSCCDVNVGAPVSATVSAGTTQTFSDVDCGTTVTLAAVEVTPDCCDFADWTGPVGNANSATTDVQVGHDDVTVTANCDAVPAADLFVNSIGCCEVEVYEDSQLVYTVQPGESWSDTGLPCCTDVDIVAVPPPPLCGCDDIELDGVSIGCLTGYVHMDGNNHTFDVYCSELEVPVPEECCWCIYLTEWWTGNDPIPPGTPPDNVEYFAMHSVEWLPAGHCEGLPGIGPYTIVPPSYHQELVAYAGPVPNGYGLAEWAPLPTAKCAGCPGVFRLSNSVPGALGATGQGYWNSQTDLMSWKTRFDVNTGLGPIVLYSVTLQSVVFSGNAGWPYSVGNAWATAGVSSVTPLSWTYNEVRGATETVDCSPLFPGGIECYVVDSYAWTDDGDMIPQPGELVPSSIKWYNNAYGCAIKTTDFPSALYMGWQEQCLIWWCFEPPYPVTEPEIPVYPPCP